MGPDFSVLLSIILAGVPGWVFPIMAVFSSLATFYVIWRGGLMILAAISGRDLSAYIAPARIRKDQVFHGGRYWDKDVYQSAMNDLKRQERSGVALDGESRRALRRHQGMK